MRKFIVHTRVVPGCCKTDEGTPITIIEVEGEMIKQAEDASVGWLPYGEFKFRILKPEFLHEPQEVRKPDGSVIKIMTSPIYHSHAIYWNIYQAQVAAERMVRESLEFTQRKTKGESFTEEELKTKIAEITTIRL